LLLVILVVSSLVHVIKITISMIVNKLIYNKFFEISMKRNKGLAMGRDIEERARLGEGAKDEKRKAKSESKWREDEEAEREERMEWRKSRGGEEKEKE
jgi:hypothetical protein